MISTKSVESFNEIAERFQGIKEREPIALARLAFHAAAHPPINYIDEFEDYSWEPWQNTATDALRDASEWRRSEDKAMSRAELATMVADRQRQEVETQQLENMLEQAPPDEVYTAIKSYLARYGFTLQTRIKASPLFPEGRTKIKTIEQITDSETGLLSINYGDNFLNPAGQDLSHPIYEFLSSGYIEAKSQEATRDMSGMLEPINEAELEALRLQFGTKVAALMLFEKGSADIRKTAVEEDSGYGMRMEIPPYFSVNVEVYRQWKADPNSLVSCIAGMREKAIALLDQETFGNTISEFVVVRSSAVYSEDSDQHTGAGVYKSIAVDPHDEQAFRQAIEEVYHSTDSPAAKSYRQGIGVEDELMGLLIQRYVESSDTSRYGEPGYFGHANSSGANPNIIEVITPQGALLYDKPAVENQLLFENSDTRSGSLLHTNPDHDAPLYRAVSETVVAPHAAVIAEKLFEKPMQIEYVGNAIVQVRPLVGLEQGQTMEFPSDLEPRFETAAMGVGDMELALLSEQDDNTESRGFVIFKREYEFTISQWHARYDALPKEGAVVIMEPSTSGHIQALCREKGLLCFYPKKGSDLDDIEYMGFEMTRHLRGDTKPLTLRFVADGYDGKIYEA